ncbi:MAG: DUF4047 domain-containing protein [Parachlamydiaceae bacterium]
MKHLETSQDKIAKICETLRNETIEPAKKDAANLIEEAKQEAERIVHEARLEAKKIKAHALEEIEQERKVFQSSLLQASKQSLEHLRQEIEHKLFNQQLDQLLEEQLKNPEIVASLINAIVKAVEDQGLSANLEAIIAKQVSPHDVNKLLLQGVLERLKAHSVAVGAFKGGAQVKLVDRKMVIDVSEEPLKELLASFVRKDFRKLIFNA